MEIDTDVDIDIDIDIYRNVSQGTVKSLTQQCLLQQLS
jgi:hypothetical protein